MKDIVAKIQISDIFLDESIYPRENIELTGSGFAYCGYWGVKYTGPQPIIEMVEITC